MKIWWIFVQLTERAVKIVHNNNDNRMNIQTWTWNVSINELNSSLILDARDKIVISLLTSNRRPNFAFCCLSSVGVKSINDTSTI